MTKIIAHRGMSKVYPENTMISFEAAYVAGADGIEFDVQMTKDGELVVIHDEMLDRTTNVTGWIMDYTFEEMKMIDASYKFSAFKGQCPIPTLDEVFKWVKGKSRPFIFNIELKNSVVTYPGIGEKIARLIKKYHWTPYTVLSSFNHYSLVELKKTFPDIEMAILYNEWLYEPWKYCTNIGVEGLHPHYKSLQREDIVNQAKKNGVPVRPYTVNKENELKRLMKLGVDAIITDDVEKAYRIRKELVDS
ncbi:glycerophosphodiester phosphodiesterase [Bacillus kexueae]|uniref:glycerophosphodiester phosphodiesterase n=1 Tax=Aeribacillus kexueae TaxID=2078952 RepID=UPI001FAF68FD|nr:glycerophosphodiester phosphodiesterase [Bacillus kexueae]